MATFSWWALVLRPASRKHWVLLVKPRGLGWTHPMVSSPKVGTQHKTKMALTIQEPQGEVHDGLFRAGVSTSPTRHGGSSKH